MSVHFTAVGVCAGVPDITDAVARCPANSPWYALLQVGADLLYRGGGQMHLLARANEIPSVSRDVDPRVVDRHGRILAVQARFDADMALGGVRPEQQPPDARGQRI